MSFARILPNNTFELYTDLHKLHKGKTGKDFNNALKGSIPQNSRYFSSQKKCWVFRYMEHLPTMKSLCEVYFSDDWITKDVRQEEPKVYLRHLMFLHPECPDDIVDLYFKSLCDKNINTLRNNSLQTISDTYDRAYRTEDPNEGNQPSPPQRPVEGS